MQNNVKIIFMIHFLWLGFHNCMLFGADAPYPYETKEVKVANALKPVVDLVREITRPGAAKNPQDREDYKMRARIFMEAVVADEYVRVGDDPEALKAAFFARPETPRSQESVRIFKEQHEILKTFLYQEGLGEKFSFEKGFSGAFRLVVDTCPVQ